MASDKNNPSQKGRRLPKAYVMPASVFKRFFSFAIDLLIINIFILGPFNSLFEALLGDDFASMYQTLVSEPGAMSSLSSAIIAASVIILLYMVILQRKFGQTIGMMVADIYVIKIPQPEKMRRMGAAKKKNTLKEMIDMSNQMRIGFFDAVLRSLFIIPLSPFILLWVIDPSYMFVSKSSQRLTEHLSRTMTIEMKKNNNIVPEGVV